MGKNIVDAPDGYEEIESTPYLDKAAEATAKVEKYVPTRYRIKGEAHDTIGYGHYIEDKKKYYDLASSLGIKDPENLDEPEAMTLFKHDFKVRRDEIARRYPSASPAILDIMANKKFQYSPGGFDKRFGEEIRNNDTEGLIKSLDYEAKEKASIGQRGFIPRNKEIAGHLREYSTEVQVKLAENGYDVGPVDGFIGPKTKEALKQFQQDRGLKPDGVLGPKTFKQLLGALNPFEVSEAQADEILQDAPEGYEEVPAGYEEIVQTNDAPAGYEEVPSGYEEVKRGLPFEAIGKNIGEIAKGAVLSLQGMTASTGGLIDMIGQNMRFDRNAEEYKVLKQAGGVSDADEQHIDRVNKAADKVAEWGKTAKDFWQNASQKGRFSHDPVMFQGSFMENPSWTRAASIVAEAVPQLGAATAMSVATGSPIVGLAFIGALEGEQTFAEARTAGTSLEKANALFAASAVGAAVLEKLPLEYFLKGGTGKRLVDAAVGGVQEGVEEGVQQVYSNILARLGYEKTRQLHEGLVESVIGGAGSGMAMGALTSGRAQKLDKQIDDAVKAGVPREAIEAMQESVAVEIAKNPEVIEKQLDDLKAGKLAAVDVKVEQPTKAVKPQEPANANQDEKGVEAGAGVSEGEQVEVKAEPMTAERFLAERPEGTVEEYLASNTPEVEEGFVRIYRGEPAGIVREIPDTGDKGKYFTTNEKTTDIYGENKFYLDVSEARYQELVRDEEEALRVLGQGEYKKSLKQVYLTPEEARQARQMRTKSQLTSEFNAAKEKQTPVAEKPAEVQTKPADNAWEETKRKVAEMTAKAEAEKAKKVASVAEVKPEQDNTAEVDAMAKRYADKIGQAVTPFHKEIASEIINKRPDKLIQLIAQGSGNNENTKRFFTQETGVKLPSTIEGKKAAIEAWAKGDVYKDPSQTFYYQGPEGYVKTKGEPVSFPGINAQFFVHKSPGNKGGGFSVNEVTSGLKVDSGSSKEGAIDNARIMIEKNKDKLDQVIANGIKKHGPSPVAKAGTQKPLAEQAVKVKETPLSPAELAADRPNPLNVGDTVYYLNAPNKEPQIISEVLPNGKVKIDNSSRIYDTEEFTYTAPRIPDAPIPGKQYQLTGTKSPSIASGNAWAESEVKPSANNAELIKDMVEHFSSPGSIIKDALETRKLAGILFGGDPKTYYDELYDAMEMGLNRQFRVKLLSLSNFKLRMEAAIKAEGMLPLRNRSLETIKNQQFSTPLSLATAANHLLSPQNGDIILEPTAGTGNLIVPFWNGDWKLIANELDPRRLEVLKHSGEVIDIQNQDFLKYNGPNPTAIISNPPFGGLSTGKYASFAADFEASNLDQRFIAKMLRILPEGGRIAVVTSQGTGSGASGSPFRKWLEKEHTFLASIASPEGAYKHRGSPTIGTALLMIEKGKRRGPVKPLIRESISGWDEYVSIIDTLKNQYPRLESGAILKSGRIGNNEIPNPATPSVRTEPTGQSAGVPSRGSERGGSVEPVGKSPDRVASVPTEQPEGSRIVADDLEQGTANVGTGERPRSAGTQDRKIVGSFIQYKRLNTLPIVSPHPSTIVESQELASVNPPPLTYKPGKALESAYRNKKISDEQMDVVLQTMQSMANGKGQLIADDVGVGKTREMAGIILDAIDTGKANRVLYVTKSQEVLNNHIATDFSEVMTGKPGMALPFPTVRLDGMPKLSEQSNLPVSDKSLYTITRDKLKSGYKNVIDIGFDLIVFDEAHEWRPENEKQKKYIAWTSIHDAMRGKPMVYVTATPGVDLASLDYLYGLGEWSKGTFDQYIASITGQEAQKKGMFSGGSNFASAGSIPMTQQFMRELKMKGLYSSRDLSRQNVKFESRTVNFTPEDIAAYDKYTAFLKKAYEVGVKYAKFNKVSGAKGLGLIKSMMQNAAKRHQVDLKVTRIINDVKKDIADGKRVFLFTSGLNELDQDAPKGYVRAVIDAINENQVESVEGEVISDKIPESIEEKELLKDELNSLPPQLSIEKYVKENIGNKYKIGFYTGNTTESNKKKYLKEWMEGKIDVMLGSDAAKTAISAHDIIGKPIVNYYLDVDFEVTKFKQALGRTNRSGEKSSPTIIIPGIGSAGEQKFIATIASRMKSLGATSKGQAESGVVDFLSEFDLDGAIAHQAARNTFSGINDADKELFLNEKLYENVGGQRVPRRVPPQNYYVDQFLYDLNFMPYEDGNRMFKLLIENYKDILDKSARTAELIAERTGGTEVKQTELYRNPENPNDYVTLHEVLDRTGHRFGILSGMLLDKTKDLVRYEVKHFVKFQTPNGLISGKKVLPSHIVALAKSFGKDMASTITFDNAYDVIMSGDKVPVGGEMNLYHRQDGSIGIQNAKMADKIILQRAGATFRPVGSAWVLKDTSKEAVKEFIRSFPIRSGDNKSLSKYGQKIDNNGRGNTDDTRQDSGEDDASLLDLPNSGNSAMGRGRMDSAGKSPSLDANIFRPNTNPDNPATSPDALIKRLDQLQKFAQYRAIPRKFGGAGKYAGLHVKGSVRLNPILAGNDALYISTLSHELGHAIHHIMAGSTRKSIWPIFGANLDAATINTLVNELKAVTNDVVGRAVAESDPGYYYRRSELFARFLEKMFVSGGNLTDLAPTAVDLFGKQLVANPILQEFVESAHGKIDQGAPKFKLLRDLRETYQKHLGQRVGNKAFNDEMLYRSMKERAKKVFGDLMESKFKGVTDTPEALFRAAEAIKVTKGGMPDFGTRNFETARTDEERINLEGMGYQVVDVITENGDISYSMAKARYTPEQARAIFNALSPRGQQLIKDFTAQLSEAKDAFNREWIKDAYKVNGNIEGWVHHYWEEKPVMIGGLKMKEKLAGTRKSRTGNQGYVEDLKKSIYKSLVDLQTEKDFNSFIDKFFATVTRPLAEGQSPLPGWVEVEGNTKKGVGTSQEKRTVIVDKETGRSFIPKRTKYQMPKDIYNRYKLIKGEIEETTAAVKAIMALNRYWRINILSDISSTGTNAISGGVQYGTKILTDFYKDVFSGDLTMEQTRRDVSAMIRVLTPAGWNKAPDWVYGADRSNFYGQFMVDEQDAVNKQLDEFGNKVLYLFGAVERYFKKAIVLSESDVDFSNLEGIDKNGLKDLTADEKDLVKSINDMVDLYAYDYDNVPVWLREWSKSPAGQAIKPFAVWPYKYSKQVLRMAGDVFDRTIPWQDRVAKLMALTTLVALYGLFGWKRREEQVTPQGDETTPSWLSPKGRLSIGVDPEGREIFVRTAKYPFLGLTDAGVNLIQGQTEASLDSVQDTLGGLGPMGQLGVLGMGYINRRSQYTPKDVIIGDALASFMPFYRTLQNVSNSLDLYPRKKEDWRQSFGSVVPTTDPNLQDLLHGSKRTIKVPVEGSVKRTPGTKKSRTTVSIIPEREREDVLLYALTGISVSRIDPEHAKAYEIRREKNLEKKAKEAMKNIKR